MPPAPMPKPFNVVAVSVPVLSDSLAVSSMFKVSRLLPVTVTAP